MAGSVSRALISWPPCSEFLLVLIFSFTAVYCALVWAYGDVKPVQEGSGEQRGMQRGQGGSGLHGGCEGQVGGKGLAGFLARDPEHVRHGGCELWVGLRGLDVTRAVKLAVCAGLFCRLWYT
jgi:hypothetical protein